MHTLAGASVLLTALHQLCDTQKVDLVARERLAPWFTNRMRSRAAKASGTNASASASPRTRPSDRWFTRVLAVRRVEALRLNQSRRERCGKRSSRNLDRRRQSQTSSSTHSRCQTALVTGYDIIGDVHGCADKLSTLLKKLGYAHSDGAYRHPVQRQVIFVGDLIDRGPFQLESVAIPRAMVEHGTAQMVIGNHEFNAAAFATRNADDSDWCRPHTDKNHGQHDAFIKAVGFGSVTHRSILDWFMSLPLWLDLGGVRVVHACWHEESIEHLRMQVGAHGGLTDELVRNGTTKGTAAYDAIETVLKGPEVGLDGYWYTDKDDNKRTKGRAEWWNTGATTLRDIVRLHPSWPIFDPNGERVEKLPPTPLTDIAGSVPPYPADAPPVLFGHYWFTDNDPKPSTPTTACVDFSAVMGGDLVAYRWDGEQTLDREKFITA